MAPLYLEGEVASRHPGRQSEGMPEQGSSSNGTLILNQLLWYSNAGLRVIGTALSKEVKG